MNKKIRHRVAAIVAATLLAVAVVVAFGDPPAPAHIQPNMAPPVKAPVPPKRQ